MSSKEELHSSNWLPGRKNFIFIPFSNFKDWKY